MIDVTAVVGTFIELIKALTGALSGGRGGARTW